MTIKNLHIYPSNFKNETRILKETKSLVESSIADKVFIAAIWEDGVEEHEQLDRKREVWRVPLTTQHLPNSAFWKILKFIEWTARIFIRFRKEHIAFVNCHSLSALPLGILFKIFLRSSVIYDTHELETETSTMFGLRKILSKVLERLLIYKVNSIITVSDSIAGWYKNQYNIKDVYVIKNVPKYKILSHSNILKEKFNIKDDEILFIYQGVLSKERGVGILLNVFSKINKKKHIVFMGYGVLENVIKAHENQSSNIHFQPAVKPDEILKYTSSAEIGIFIIPENVCLSYSFSLPNKFFEYIYSGLPLIVSHFVDMGKIIDDYECGWKVSVNEKSLIELIGRISKEEIKEKRNNVLKCRDNYSWENEEKKLLGVYQKLRTAK